jgi:hypothetical protein
VDVSSAQKRTLVHRSKGRCARRQRLQCSQRCLCLRWHSTFERVVFAVCRSNQVLCPIYKIVSSNICGEHRCATAAMHQPRPKTQGCTKNMLVFAQTSTCVPAQHAHMLVCCQPVLMFIEVHYSGHFQLAVSCMPQACCRVLHGCLWTYWWAMVNTACQCVACTCP